MELHLLLSGRCNLACSYCYQNARRIPAQMSLATAEAALEVVLGAGDPPHRVVLSGGEPLLARALVHDVVGLLHKRARQLSPIERAILTNGTLVGEADLEWMAEHDVEMQVSFDGVECVQAVRAPGTFATLERLLDRAFERQPRWARKRLAVAMTVQAATVPNLAESVRRLMDRGIGDLRIVPLKTHDPGWSRTTREQLRDQVGRVSAISLEHWKRTREIPVGLLRGRPLRSRVAALSVPGPLCAVSSGRNVAIDAAGHTWTCPSFVGSVQDLPPLGQEAADTLDIGDIHDPDFGSRLKQVLRRAGSLPLLRAKAKKWSSRGRCRDCSFAPECLVCPASTMHIPGNRDPHRVAEHYCDFRFVTLGARREFQARIRASAPIPEMPW